MDNDDFEITIESTMVSPLFARAYYGNLYPEILKDPKAESLYSRTREIYSDADREFAAVEELIEEFLGLTLLIRSRVFDDAVKRFISNHPQACVVNLGCGLETNFFRVDTGKIRWFDLDLPEAIEYRANLIPETERCKYIAKSVFNRDWFTELDYSQKDGIFFIAGGLFGYFEEKEVASLFHDMAEFFVDGEMIFDINSKIGNTVVNRRLEQFGAKGVKFELAIGNPKRQMNKWSDQIEILDSYPLFSRLPLDPRWKRKTRYTMKLSNLISAVKCIHVKFK